MKHYKPPFDTNTEMIKVARAEAKRYLKEQLGKRLKMLKASRTKLKDNLKNAKKEAKKQTEKRIEERLKTMTIAAKLKDVMGTRVGDDNGYVKRRQSNRIKQMVCNQQE